jgi:hypothetical protein
MMKKIISLILILSLCSLYLLPVDSAAQANHFTDIAGHKAKNEINKWREYGFISGYGDGTYKPDQPITRAEFTSIVSAALGLQEKSDENFTDVTPHDWFAGAFAKAKYQGYLAGYGDGTVRPYAYLSRQEAMVIIANILRLTKAENTEALSAFKDADQISVWSMIAIHEIVRKGYDTGYPDGTFRPATYDLSPSDTSSGGSSGSGGGGGDGGSSNRTPIADDDAFTISEDASSELLDVLANDSDVDGDSLSIEGCTAAAHGHVTRQGESLRYTPAVNFFGSDSFTYTISDGKGGTDTATVTITVTPVNDTPEAADDTATMYEGASVLIDVLANDSDVDGDSLSIEECTAAAHGTTTIENNKIRYAPEADYIGTDSFIYTVSDGNGSSTTATVTVTVNAIQAYASAYHYAAPLDPVISDAIPFSHDGPINEISHTPGSSDFTVLNSGQYKIDYSVDISSGGVAFVGIAVNGIVKDTTCIATLHSSGRASGSTILTLAAGDTISLRKYSGPDITLNAVRCSAQISIVRVSGEMASIAYIMQTLEDLAKGAYIPFSDHTVKYGFTHASNTSEITVSSSGTYKIDYVVNSMSSNDGRFIMTVNDLTVQPTYVKLLESIGQVSCSAILYLSAGDVIKVQNASPNSLSLPTEPAVAAQFNIYKVSGEYASVYLHSTPAVIIGGAAIPFNLNAQFSGIVHAPGATDITIASTGNYKIDYTVNAAIGSGAEVAVAVNGTAMLSTSASIHQNNSQVSGSTILELAAGDVISLLNDSLIGLTLSGDGCGAQMTIIKLPESQ